MAIGAKFNGTLRNFIERQPLFFPGAAMIPRVYGHAKAFHPRDPLWSDFIDLFPPAHGLQGRTGAANFCHSTKPMGEEGLRAYWKRKNTLSIDGKPTNIKQAPF